MATIIPATFIAQLQDQAGQDPEDLEPNDQAVLKLRLKDLRPLAKHLNLTFKSNALKKEMQELVFMALYDQDLVSEQLVESLAETAVAEKSVLSGTEALELKRLEMQAAKEEKELASKTKELELRLVAEEAKIKAEAEAEKIRSEARRIEAEALLKEAQARAISEGQMLQVGDDRHTSELQGNRFDVSKNVRLVPPFSDKDLDSYFLTFEHAASVCDWPREKWTILLSTVLKGKAQTAYANMEARDKYSYEKVKMAVLKAYELVPEAYRQSFREVKKRDNQTYTEFVKEKEKLFDRWCKSRNVDSVETMRNLILLEDFRDKIPKDIRMHLDDLDVVDLHVAARKADDYSVAHKLLSSQERGAKEKKPYSNQKDKKENWSNGRRDNRQDAFNPRGGGSQSRTSQSESRKCMLHNTESHSSEQCFLLKRLKGQGIVLSNPADQAQVSTVVSNPQTKEKKTKTQGADREVSSRQGQTNQTNPVSLTVSGPVRDIELVDPCSSIESKYCREGQGPVFSADSTDCSEGQVSDRSDGTCCVGFEIDPRFEPFVSTGSVSIPQSSSKVALIEQEYESSDNEVKVTILRDTGSSQSLLLKGQVNLGPEQFTGRYVLVSGIAGQTVSIPLYRVVLHCGVLTPSIQEVVVGVSDSLPVSGVTFLLGNDLAQGRVVSEPILSSTPVESTSTEILESKYQDIGSFAPACVVTRSQARKQDLDSLAQQRLGNNELDTGSEVTIELADTFMTKLTESEEDQLGQSTQEKVANAQRKDAMLVPYFSQVVEDWSSEDPVCFVMHEGVLLRKWRSPTAQANEPGAYVYQVVVPEMFRQHVLELGHDSIMAGHRGVRKTKWNILQSFWWPGIAKDVAEYVKTCHTCQITKTKQKPTKHPLKPVPVLHEPFSEILLDVVGPLCKTSKGHEYCLSIMCTATRFCEVVPLRKCTAQAVTDALIKFFTMFGLAKRVRSDQGTHFTARILKEVLKQLGIEQIFGCAYRPETQGAVERFHGTLKTVLKAYIYEHEKDWDVGLPFLMFALRNSVHEGLGYSPAELVFGHTPRGPLQLLQEQCFDRDQAESVLTYVAKMKIRLREAVDTAQRNMLKFQGQMKARYDVGAQKRTLKVGNEVLALLPMQGDPLKMVFSGPYKVEQVVDDMNYLIATPDRRKKTQYCHINMLKQYFPRAIEGKPDDAANTKRLASSTFLPENAAGTKRLASSKFLPTPRPEQKVGSVLSALSVFTDVHRSSSSAQPMEDEIDDFEVTIQPVKLGNSNVLQNLTNKLSHLDSDKQSQLQTVIQEFADLFPDVPGKAKGLLHDVDVGDSKPVRQHPYRCGPEKQAIMEKEIEYMLKHNIIEPCSSPWLSPCLLRFKPDGSARFITDFRAVNKLTKSDCYPLPRIDTLIDEVGSSQYVTKLDLLKGYWQIPLTERAKEVSAFSTGSGLYRYLVCPFGMKNSGASFCRLMDVVVTGLDNTRVYVDDLVVYSGTWEDHVHHIRALFSRLRLFNLTVNLVKSEFGHAKVQYLGHIVGSGQVFPVQAKVQGILDFPIPGNRKALSRFNGMVMFYRKFCPNLSVIMAPLTDLLSPKIPFIWSEECQRSFDKVKAILTNSPVLRSVDFSKEFHLYVDASDLGCGAALVQEDEAGIEHPISYFSKKFNRQQKNYSTIEKEALGLLSALKHFEVYLSSTRFPVQVYTDHNPLVFVNRMKNSNQRLLRWSLSMQEYNLNIQHVKGKDNVVADALSRS